jgi:predicted regulator of Ras-like GTPase activity (Roadblock/LC7/MglB family)
MVDIVQAELQQIVKTIPNIQWIRIIQVDGLSHPTYRFDSNTLMHNPEREKEEDRISAMSAFTMGLWERVLFEMGLGKSQFSVLAGEGGTHFLLPIDDGTEWLLSFIVKGRPSVDVTLQYF